MIMARISSLFLVGCMSASDPDSGAPPADGTPTPAPTTPPEPTRAPSPTTSPTGSGSNVLLVILDDVGVDGVGAYGVGENAPNTPRIDGLAESGVTFLHAYGNASCSPTRAMIQTGRHAFRTGIGHVLGPDSYPLQPEEITLAEMVAATHATSLVGKWHLGGADFDSGPNLQGYTWYGGTLIGIETESILDGGFQQYDDWEKTTNGVLGRSTTYATTEAANDAIARMAAMPEPWLLVLSFNAAHAPFHWPPDDLWSGDIVGTFEAQQQTHAMVEALDTELGRVLDALPENTLGTQVMVIGDNGSTAEIGGTPEGKGSMYDAGVRIPLIVSGPAVLQPGTESHAVVSAVDVFPTIAELLGIEVGSLPVPPVIDGISFVPQLHDPATERPGAIALSEQFTPTGPPPWRLHDSGAREHGYRLVRKSDIDELYAIGEEHVEGEDLLADGLLTPDEKAAYDRLAAVIKAAEWEE